LALISVFEEWLCSECQFMRIKSLKKQLQENCVEKKVERNKQLQRTKNCKSTQMLQTNLQMLKQFYSTTMGGNMMGGGFSQGGQRNNFQRNNAGGQGRTQGFNNGGKFQNNKGQRQGGNFNGVNNMGQMGQINPMGMMNLFPMVS